MCNQEPMFIAIIEDINDINNTFRVGLRSYEFENDFFLQENDLNIIRHCNELSFLYVIAFLYKLYEERGKVNLKYVIKKYNIFNIDKDQSEKHLEVVHDFRTFLFHFLDETQNHNKSIKKRVQLWFLGIIGKTIPETEEEWGKCVISILADAKEFLTTIKQCLCKTIELNDESIIEEWLRYVKRDLPKHKIMELLIEVIKKYEIVMDERVFLEKNISKIKNKMNLLNFELYESIENKVKLEIENLIFQPGNVTCPLSGEDIQKVFKVSGKQLGVIKNKAIKIFNNDIYLTKTELIGKLNDEFVDLLTF